jgi:di/tricarboxylate transporter
MCLLIATPPNAIAYGSGQLDTRDLFECGLLIGGLAPIVVTVWCWLVFGR